MSDYAVYCVPAPDAVAVSPCGSVGAVGYVPMMQAVGGTGDLNVQQGAELYVWSFSLFGIMWMLGLVIGSMVKVIRSA